MARSHFFVCLSFKHRKAAATCHDLFVRAAQHVRRPLHRCIVRRAPVVCERVCLDRVQAGLDVWCQRVVAD